jgi:mono/diheme cytochrome c family protein
MPKATIAVFAALALVTCTAPGFAADALRGKQFASRVCSTCHVVFEGQSPRNPNAPSFQSVANSPQFREKGVRLLWEQHPTMPNISVTQEQSDDLAAYIKSLAK